MESVIGTLAETYPVLYVRPCEGGEEKYRDVVLRGIAPENLDLRHFRGSGKDWIRTVATPTGGVPVIFLYHRKDFETFIQIMARRCKPDPIPKTIGATAISGVVNRKKIARHHAKYIKEGGTDWDGEFKRFTADKANYTDTLVVISQGPYSAVTAEAAGFPENKWLELSREIRLWHECSHVVGRRWRAVPEDRVKEELIADAAGLYGAIGIYDERLARLFMGIGEDGYTGGRLENYVDDKTTLDEEARRAAELIEKIGAIAMRRGDKDPFKLLEVLLREL